jgi:hypothetical protein
MEESNRETFHKYLNEYREQLKKGAIREAYKGH